MKTRPRITTVVVTLALLVSLVLVLFGQKTKYLEADSDAAFKHLYNGTAGLGSSDFLGTLYLGTDDRWDYFLFEHSIGDDLGVKVPVGTIKLSGRMTKRSFGSGIPLAAIMMASDYADLKRAPSK